MKAESALPACYARVLLDTNVLLSAALAANVCRLVSGDDDLLCLHPIGELHILTPRSALDEINRLRGSDRM